MSCETYIFFVQISFKVMTGAEINILGVGVDSNALLIAISLVICTCLLLGNTYMYKNKIFI